MLHESGREVDYLKYIRSSLKYLGGIDKNFKFILMLMITSLVFFVHFFKKIMLNLEHLGIFANFSEVLNSLNSRFFIKKTIALWSLIFVSYSAASQGFLKNPERDSTLKRVRLSIGLGTGTTYQYGGVWLGKSAPSIHIEPQLRIRKGFYIGVRLENSFIKYYRATYNPSTKINEQYRQIKASPIFSWVLTAEKHFLNSDKTFIPFMGIGIGSFYRGKGELLANNNKRVDLGSCSGVVFRFGMTSNKVSVMTELNQLWENGNVGSYGSWWGNSGGFRGRSYASIKVSYLF